MISFDDQIACLAREIALRRNVYPKWVAKGNMRQEEADREVTRMEAALQSVKALQQLKLSGA